MPLRKHPFTRIVSRPCGCMPAAWRRSDRAGEIEDPQLRPLVAAPAVEGQRRGKVDGLAARREQRLPERFLRRAEGDAADAGAIATAQLDADMAAAADRHRIRQPMRRKDEDRLGTARAEGAGLLYLREEAGARAAGTQRRIDQQCLGLACAGDLAGAILENRNLAPALLLDAICRLRVEEAAAAISALSGMSATGVMAILQRGRFPTVRALFESAGLGRATSTLLVEAALLWREAVDVPEGDAVTDIAAALREKLACAGAPAGAVDDLLSLAGTVVSTSSTQTATRKAA